jgi:transposase
MGPTIQQALAYCDLLPGRRLLASGYVDAELLVTAQIEHQIDIVGPTFGSYSRQQRAGQGYDLSTFIIDWEAKQAHCPQGQTSVKWTPGRDVLGDAVIRIRFDAATCHTYPVRMAGTVGAVGELDDDSIDQEDADGADEAAPSELSLPITVFWTT